tara:strand:+ start:139 stop:354 length:216 start_codon:yes stop_codon:yes gene_type:complete
MSKKVIKADNWDGKSRISNDVYRERWQEIFGKKEEDELAESYKQSKKNKKEHTKKEENYFTVKTAKEWLDL